MAILFGAKKNQLDEDPHKRLTRFSQCHQRDVPNAIPDNGIDPIGQLSRSTMCHNRAPVSYASRSVNDTQTLKNRNKSISTDLHATDPISVDVLRRALPIRSAMIQD